MAEYLFIANITDTIVALDTKHASAQINLSHKYSPLEISVKMVSLNKEAAKQVDSNLDSAERRARRCHGGTVVARQLPHRGHRGPAGGGQGLRWR